MPGPTERGTLQLLWSCTSTFILCIWTAMHPNVVPVRGVFPTGFYKAALMIVAVLLPEMVLCMAAAQFFHAKDVHIAWKEKWADWRNRNQGRRTGNNEEEWLGLSGAFFVVMGGFVVDTRKGGASPLVTTITGKGFIELLENDTIQSLVDSGELKKEHFDHFNVEDKGKASNIAKAIVVCQATWMAVQIAGRKASGLPVTLLEAHVAIQILYSVTAYIFWWKKPLDVAEPISIPLDESYLGSHDPKMKTRGDIRDQSFITEDNQIWSATHMFFRVAHDVSMYLGGRVELYSAITALINCALHATVWNSHFPTTTERLLWRLSVAGIGLFPTITYVITVSNRLDRYLLKWFFSTRSYSKNIICRPFQVAQGLWYIRLEACGLRDAEDGRRIEPEGWFGKIHPCLRIVLVDIVILSTSLYLASITYLTIEAFISLRSLPAGSYSLPIWSHILPHI
ncbi:hypothetical protein BDV25DRAFT_130317 [Aspergillus avenaceus]|uniref:Uncharacterized protein n=1 Tax=Aspergillus avenaceus TaxID=36643 RepID=A0A5N6TSZ0_ASPAV|nr:hypothetical protein BDV25DRAFT_130317 [Aspergillus avenaceus]